MNKKPYIISITAIAGGGKSTVTRALCSKLCNAEAVYFDDYEYDKQPDNICEWVENGSPSSAWDLSIFINKINDIMANKIVEYIILDYPFGRQNYPVKDYIDLTVFIHTPHDVALARRIIRDFKNATAQDIISDLSFYLERSRPCYIAHSNDMLKSDFVVDGNLTVNEIVERIIGCIREHDLVL